MFIHAPQQPGRAMAVQSLTMQASARVGDTRGVGCIGLITYCITLLILLEAH